MFSFLRSTSRIYEYLVVVGKKVIRVLGLHKGEPELLRGTMKRGIDDLSLFEWSTWASVWSVRKLRILG